MSIEHDAPTDASGSPDRPPELKPPPRLTPPSAPRPTKAVSPATWQPATERPIARSRTRSALATWLTLAFFGVLMLTALAVFVVLPDWVRERQMQAQVADVETSQETTEVPGTPEEESLTEVPLTEVPGTETDTTEVPGTETGTETVIAEAEIAETEIETRTPPSAAPAKAETKPAPAPPQRQPSSQRQRPTPTPGDDEFRRSMSEGLAALDRQDYGAARDAFSRAGELRPDSSQSADGLAQAEAGERLASIHRLRDEAGVLEAKEDWATAQQRYEAMLELDPTIELAIDGRARTSRRAELDKRLAFHLKNRSRLSSDEVLEEASAILEQATELEAGAKLTRQRQELADAIQAFSTPVTATLESDQLTDIVIYKVGRLGSFRQHALDLRPGTYTVVGSRQGFRDVRRQLVIEPGVAPQPLAIRCEEEI